MYSFLRNSKGNKVKRNVCINNVLNGGLGMVDIESKFNSLRLSWIAKFLSESKGAWKVLFSYWISKIGGFPLFLRFNCQGKDFVCLGKQNKLPQFYLDLLNVWANIRYIDILKVTDIGNQIIWNNSNIKYDNKLLFFKRWSDLGIVSVKQVVTDGCWKEVNDILNDFESKNLLCHFELSKLKKAFPIIWLNKTKDRQYIGYSQEDLFEISTGDLINIRSMKAKHYNNLYVEMKQTEPYYFNFWIDYFRLQGDFLWDKVMFFKFKYIKDNKIKQFNFKLLHRILPSKDNLFKWNILSDNHCNICRCQETTMHMLFECKEVKILWRIIERMIFFIYIRHK